MGKESLCLIGVAVALLLGQSAPPPKAASKPFHLHGDFEAHPAEALISKAFNEKARNVLMIVEYTDIGENGDVGGEEEAGTALHELLVMGDDGTLGEQMIAIAMDTYNMARLIEMGNHMRLGFRRPLLANTAACRRTIIAALDAGRTPSYIQACDIAEKVAH